MQKYRLKRDKETYYNMVLFQHAKLFDLNNGSSSKNTHSNQVPGPEEPVDLGWFCGFMIMSIDIKS